MERCTIEPRSDWRTRVESQGLHFHSDGPERYWDETAYYVFTSIQIDELERATYCLNEMCLQAVQHVIDADRFADLQIPTEFAPFIRRSWEKDELTVYGRFDLAYDGSRPPALLEYNADTPTSLVEAAVVQWYWFKDLTASALPRGYDQMNSIHERLVEAWTTARNSAGEDGDTLYFAGVEMAQSVEDYITLQYLCDTAVQAGWRTRTLAMSEIGWHSQRRCFVDPTGATIGRIFKLYPWEWMIKEEFGRNLLVSPTRWWEPPWKMLLSNKALLAILWELFPESPYLLPTAFERVGTTYVRKPFLSREGANVAIVHNETVMLETGGEYGDGPFVYQDFRPLPNFDGSYVVVGSWMVNGYACGLGLREDATLITRNTSRFLPHLFRKQQPDQ